MDLSQNPQFSESLHAIIDNHEAKEELEVIWTQIKNNAKAQQLLARLVAMEYADNEVRRSAEKLKIGNLTVLQQSYCFMQGRLNENQLSHPVIQSLYTTLETTKQTVLTWINDAGYLSAPQEVNTLRIISLVKRHNCDANLFYYLRSSISLHHFWMIDKTWSHLFRVRSSTLAI